MVEPMAANADCAGGHNLGAGTAHAVVQVWDKGQVALVEKAIRESGLGLNPMADGQLVRIPLPELNEERREELVKVAGRYAEQARVAVRNVRRDGMDQIKKAKKTVICRKTTPSCSPMKCRKPPTVTSN